MNPSRKPLAALLSIALVTGAIYFRTVVFDFVTYDDGVYVTENAQVRAGLTWNGVKHAFTTGETGTWQPLTLVSHMLDCTLYGQNAAGHHATNAILHALNTFLLGLVLLRMTGAEGPSLFTAAVFGLHPLHVESVAWVSERKDVLSTVFFMVTLYAYARWSENLRKGWLVAATGSMAIGLLVKPMLVTLPCVLLLLDYWPLRRVWCEHRARCVTLLLAEKLPMFALALASSLVTIVVQRGARATSTLDAVPLTMRLENAAVTYLRYIGKTFWPSDLLIFYPHPLGSLTAFQAGASAFILLFVTACAWALRGRARYAIVGWLWYLGTLVPVIGIVQVGTQAMADRYTYVPMIGLLIVVSWGVRDAIERIGASTGILALRVAWCIVLGIFVVLTWSRIGIWRNSETLYRGTMETMPDNALANMGLGLLLVDQERYADAIPYLETAIQKKHREPEAHYHLGIAYQELNKYTMAEKHYRSAIELNPGYSHAWNNLGVTLDVQGQRDKALAAFERAVETGPQNEAAAANLVRYLIQLGRIGEARQRAGDALNRFPESRDIKTAITALDAMTARPITTPP